MNVLDLIIHSRLRETIFVVLTFVTIVSIFAGRISFLGGMEFIWAIALYEILNFIARLIIIPFKKNKDAQIIAQMDK
jgi:hypothetical protein